MKNNSQIFLIFVIILITIYGSLVKNNTMIAISGLVISVSFILFESKNWQNILLFLLIIITSFGYFYDLDILKLIGFVLLSFGLYITRRE